MIYLVLAYLGLFVFAYKLGVAESRLVVHPDGGYEIDTDAPTGVPVIVKYGSLAVVGLYALSFWGNTFGGAVMGPTASKISIGNAIVPIFTFEPDDYTDSADMVNTTGLDIKNDEPANCNVTLFVDTGDVRPSSGTKAVQRTFKTTENVGDCGLNVRLYNFITVDEGLREYWIEMEMKFESAWEMASDDKTIFLMHSDSGQTGEGSNRFEIHFRDNETQTLFMYTSDAEVRTSSPPFSTGNCRNLRSGATEPRTQASDCNAGSNYIRTTYADGQWRVLRWYVKIQSNESVYDGGTMICMDDTKLMQFDNTVIIRKDTTGNANPLHEEHFDWIALGRNGDVVTAPTSMYWGKINVYDTNPNWSCA